MAPVPEEQDDSDLGTQTPEIQLKQSKLATMSEATLSTEEPPAASAKESGPPPVPFRQLFRYADRKDRWLISAGLLAAVLSSMALPAVVSLFGNVTEALAEFGLNQTADGSAEKLSDAIDMFVFSILGTSALQMATTMSFVFCLYYAAARQEAEVELDDADGKLRDIKAQVEEERQHKMARMQAEQRRQQEEKRRQQEERELEKCRQQEEWELEERERALKIKTAEEARERAARKIPYTPWVAVAARSPTDESDQEMDITQVWDHSWKFTADTEPCMQLWFDPAQGSPNDAVARIWAERVVADGARALPRGWWPRPWRQRPAPDPVALCRAQSAD
ncbi:Folate receptor alpha [Amphibalanus amphitrite]|uniref:Folate receptor alpha n=1 Tax=Amphibalanus amphitrite TaxID=1232801 RepID=A0A6A4WI37_AMPAM|nr:Folate receptor alpha [Amphibalanus amphitrite]